MTDRATKKWGKMTDAEKSAVPEDVLNDPANPLCISWGEWSSVAKGAVLLAAHSGEAIEADMKAFDWQPIAPDAIFDFTVVRIKSKPKFATVDMSGRQYSDGVWGFDSSECDSKCTYSLTFPTKDGAPITGTFHDGHGNKITLGLVEHVDAPQPEKVSGDDVEALVCCGCGKPSTHRCMADCGITHCGAYLCDECCHIDEKVGWRHGPRQQSSSATGNGGKK